MSRNIKYRTEEGEIQTLHHAVIIEHKLTHKKMWLKYKTEDED